MAAQPKAFFLPAQPPESGHRFCLLFPSALGSTPKALVLHLHAFAEEMNKSRRMVALQARALANSGCDVLLIDLLGCGDSSGDFGDATWATWVNDAVQGCKWLRARHPSNDNAVAQSPLWLWGLRAGCLIAVEAARELNEPCNLLLWQPPVAGKNLLQQFLRLKMASDMLGGQAKGTMEAMRSRLAAEESIEVAGYTISPALAAGLDRASLGPSHQANPVRKMVWLEVSSRQDADLSPLSIKLLAEWRALGTDCQSDIVQGPAFWQTLEIEDALELVDATVLALLAPGSAPRPPTGGLADVVTI